MLHTELILEAVTEFLSYWVNVRRFQLRNLVMIQGKTSISLYIRVKSMQNIL